MPAYETLYQTTSLLDPVLADPDRFNAAFAEGDWQIVDVTLSQPVGADVTQWLYDKLIQARLLEPDGPGGVQVTTHQETDGYHLLIQTEVRNPFIIPGIIALLIVVALTILVITIGKVLKESGPIVQNTVALGAGAVVAVAAAVAFVVLITR